MANTFNHNGKVVINDSGQMSVNTTSVPYVDDKLLVSGGNIIIENNRSYLQYSSAGARVSVISLNSSNNISVGQSNVNHGSLNLYGGTGVVTINAGASEVARFTTAGNVGIGTTTPYGRLELNGNGNSSTTAPAIRMWDSFNLVGWLVGNVNNINPGDFYIRTLPSVSGNPRNSEQEFTIKHATGNVGIGTTAPDAKLVIVGSGTGLAKIGDVGFGSGNYTGISLNGTLSIGSYNFLSSPTDSALYINRPIGSTIRFRENNNDQVVIAVGGNVGIGTTSPLQRLDVSGYVRATSGFVGNGGLSLWGDNSSLSAGLFVTTGGNVGIGTTSPSQKLQVSGSVALNTATDGTSRYYTYPDVNHSWYYDDNIVGSSADVMTYYENFLVRHQDTTNVFLINGSGNVGIGTTSPLQLLHVAGLAYFGSDIFGAVNNGIFFSGNNSYNAGIYGRNSGSDLVLQGGGSERMRIVSSGNVGIGTSVPANKLVVTSDASPTSENSYSIAAASASDPAYKTVIGYDFTNDIGLIAAVRTGIGWRNISMPQGSLGLGNIAPTEKLHITGNIRVTGAYYDSNNGAGTSGQVLSSTGTGTAWITASGTGTVTGTGSANRIPYWSSTSNLTFNSNLYWDNTNSRLGIGTTAPSAKVHLVEGNFVTRFLVGQSTFTGYNSGLTAGQKGNIIVGQANSTNNAYVINFIYQASSSTSNAIGLGFFNNDDIVVITAGKSVGIATTSPNTSYTTTIASVAGKTGVLLAQGNVKIDGGALGVGVNASGTAGRIDASNDIVPFSSSDLRLKENIKNIESPIEKVKKLNGIEFDWIKELEEHHGYSGHDTGVIAQEVQDVLPTAVRTNASGYLAVRYEKLIGLLIEAVKEQQAEIDYLKSKI